MLGQARAARERVLSDLARRRKVAVNQVELLRSGRERLQASIEVARAQSDSILEELKRSDEEAKRAADQAARQTPNSPALGPSGGEGADLHDEDGDQEEGGLHEGTAEPTREHPTAGPTSRRPLSTRPRLPPGRRRPRGRASPRPPRRPGLATRLWFTPMTGRRGRPLPARSPPRRMPAPPERSRLRLRSSPPPGMRRSVRTGRGRGRGPRRGPHRHRRRRPQGPRAWDGATAARGAAGARRRQPDGPGRRSSGRRARRLVRLVRSSVERRLRSPGRLWGRRRRCPPPGRPTRMTRYPTPSCLPARRERPRVGSTSCSRGSGPTPPNHDDTAVHAGSDPARAGGGDRARRSGAERPRAGR